VFTLVGIIAVAGWLIYRLNRAPQTSPAA
jgi:hypothetical protein